VAVQVDVSGQRALRPLRRLVIASGAKELDQFVQLDVHAHSFGLKAATTAACSGSNVLP
jgi:hypothetical protein